MSDTVLSDYSLTGRDTAKALAKGLAEATWYTSPVPKATMRELLVRKDGPAIRDMALWFALLFVSGGLGYWLWQAGSWLAILPFFIYGTIYASTADSRWHESSHGTAFKTGWMNDVLYEIASFMVMRESTPWRWSHTRHHSDTIIVGRDPEIAVPRPPSLTTLFLTVFCVPQGKGYFIGLFRHMQGRLTESEKTFIPESAIPRIALTARIHLAIYATVILLAVWHHSILPLLFIGLPNLYGTWLMLVYGHTQHTGLAENVLDHRLNCRTVYMNGLNRFLYWNMGYHVEHHMFPLVPYHQLPKLHAVMKDDCPVPYPSIAAAFKEIIPTVLRQRTDPTHFVQRELPATANRTSQPTVAAAITTTAQADGEGWITVCPEDNLVKADVVRFDHQGRTWAIYRTAAGNLHATDGICTHGSTHLADGFIKDNLIECPKHNGRFDITDGSVQRAPVCVALSTWPVRTRQGNIELNTLKAGGAGAGQKTWRFTVVSNVNVATFIKELVLEPLDGDLPPYLPGQYLQLDVPAYPAFPLSDIAVDAPFAEAWRSGGVFAGTAVNPVATRRNYSLASNPALDRQLRFNVRLATAPRGTAHPAGAGSAHVFRLKAGDTVTAIGPFGDFLIKPGEREMVYIGGGAGMAPLRSHLAHLFDTHECKRTVSYWYGARSLQEVFYRDYFNGLASQHAHFHFHLALSEPRPEDAWSGPTGFIHDVVLREHLARHPDPTAVDYYLCGPPAMIAATTAMLTTLGVHKDRVAFDAF